jgi:hypothetical protein
MTHSLYTRGDRSVQFVPCRESSERAGRNTRLLTALIFTGILALWLSFALPALFR